MSAIYLRRAKTNDLDAIMKIVEEARELLKKDGSPQWQDGHPNRETFEQDISRGINWVLVVGDHVAGTATLMLDPDPAYKVIYNGQWSQPNAPYATIHRVAISSHYRGQGLSKILFSNLITVAQLQDRNNIRLDTHEQNKRMQKLVQDFGFIRCGNINVEDRIDPKRIAFELNLRQGYKVTNDFMKGLLK